MPDNSQIVQVPFRAGLDEGTDTSQLAPGSLTRILNGTWKKLGRVEKRDGSTTLASTVVGGGAPGTIQRLFARGQELAGTDGTDLFSYVRAAGAWRRIASQPAVSATWRTLVDTGQRIYNVDVAANASYRVTVWLSSRSVSTADAYVQVEDLQSGALLMPPTRLQVGAISAAAVRVIIVGGSAFIFWNTTLSTDLVVQSLNLSTLALGSITTLITATGGYDVAQNGANFTVLHAGAGVVKTYSTSYALLFTSAALGVLSPVSIHVTPGEFCYVAGLNAGSFLLQLVVLNADTLATVTSAVTVRTGSAASTPQTYVSICRVSATSCVVAWTERYSGALASGTNEFVYSVVVSSAGVVSAGTLRCTDWARLTTRLFALGGRIYALLATIRDPITVAGARLSQNSVFAVEVGTTVIAAAYPHKLAAMLAPREGASTAPTSGFPGISTVPVVGGNAYAPVLVTTGIADSSDAAVALIRMVTLSTTLPDPWAEALVGTDLVMGGGPNQVYDGRRPFEVNFLQGPRVLKTTTGTAGSMAAGTYQYTFVFEWRDATGLLHRSTPTQPVSVTVSASGSVVFDLECATTTCKTDEITGDGTEQALPVRIIPFRTTVGGTTFYRMNVGGYTNLIVNSPLKSSTYSNLFAAVSWTDTSPDTGLTSRPLLYTTGQILDEVMPPSFITCTLHRSRIWGVAGDRRTIWFSKRFSEDPTVFPGFHEALRVTTEQDVVALYSLDDKLIIFCTEAIYILFGDGPNAQGAQSDLDGPTLLTANVGCLSARSVVNFPGGLMFQAAQGFYVLSRELAVSWVGRPVRDELEAYPTVLSATLVPHKSQVRLACSSADGLTGATLVYDYEIGNWSVFTYDGTNAPVQSAVVLSGATYLAIGPGLRVEDTTTSLDNGTWVTLDFELVLTPSGPVAWQHVRRVQLLGARQTHHDLRIRFAFDYRGTYAQDFTFPAQMVAQNNDSPTLRIGSQNGANPKCRALTVRVTDATPTTPGTYPVGSGKAGWFSAVGLEFIPKPGMARHGARYSKV